MDTLTLDDTDIKAAPTKRRRRRYSITFKQQVVAEVLAGHDSVSVIARRHDLNANLVFKWKREQQRHANTEAETSGLIPIAVTPTEPATAPASSQCGRIDIALPTGERVSVYDEVSVATLQTVLTALRS